MEKVDGLGLVVSRQEGTDQDYRGRIRMLTHRAVEALGREATLLETITCLGLRHGEYEPATIRKYYAALTFAVDEAVALGELDMANGLAHRDALASRPRPRPDDAERRTSARKRKNVTKMELYLVCTFLLQRGKADDKLLVLLLVHGVFLGLRPSDSDADLQNSLLVIHTRKATNGRGLGEFRELDLSDISSGELASIHRLITDFAAASRDELARLLDMLGARLRRACLRVGIEPIALYTTRHQAIANMKSAGRSAVEIAAAVGHSSLRRRAGVMRAGALAGNRRPRHARPRT